MLTRASPHHLLFESIKLTRRLLQSERHGRHTCVADAGAGLRAELRHRHGGARLAARAQASVSDRVDTPACGRVRIHLIPPAAQQQPYQPALLMARDQEPEP